MWCVATLNWKGAMLMLYEQVYIFLIYALLIILANLTVIIIVLFILFINIDKELDKYKSKNTSLLDR